MHFFLSCAHLLHAFCFRPRCRVSKGGAAAPASSRGSHVRQWRSRASLDRELVSRGTGLLGLSLQGLPLPAAEAQGAKVAVERAFIAV